VPLTPPPPHAATKLGQAIAIIEKEMNGGASLLQSDSMDRVAQALQANPVARALGFCTPWKTGINATWRFN
jgi:hypothetical protein